MVVDEGTEGLEGVVGVSIAEGDGGEIDVVVDFVVPGADAGAVKEVVAGYFEGESVDVESAGVVVIKESAREVFSEIGGGDD